MGAHILLLFPCKACGGQFPSRRFDYETGRKMYCGPACYTRTRPRGFKRSRKTDYERKKESIARHPEKHRCRTLFRRAVRSGQLEAEPCFICGDEKTEGHHWDYARPLDVFWLCRQHHVDVHMARLELPLPGKPELPAVLT